MLPAVLLNKGNLFPPVEITLAKAEAPAAQQEKNIEIFPSIGKEKGFSYKKYFTLSLIIAAIANTIFPVCFSTSIALFGLASWYLWSAIIIVVNQAADNTCLEKPIRRLHATAMEVNSIVAAAVVFPLTLFKSYHGPHGNLKGRPILMVSGYLSFGSIWHYQRQRLIQAGFGPIYTVNEGIGESIAIYAKQIQQKVSQIQKETGKKEIILIGHSKGGLVSSYYATHLADSTSTTITDIITIGSPLAGARPIAYIGPGEDAAEMRPDSTFHRELRDEIQEHPEIRFFHIASKSDEIVPFSSELLGEDSSRHFVLKDIM